MSEATPPSAKRRRLDLTESFKLIIGPQKKEIIVHKEVPTKSSDFFKACCAGHDWKESTSKVINLPEDSPDAATTYIQWLYSGELVVTDEPLPERERATDEAENRKTASTAYNRLRDLSIFGDKVGDNLIMNAVVDCYLLLRERLGFRPPQVGMSTIYLRLPATAPVRNLVKDLFLASVTPDAAENVRNQLPKDFVFDMMKILLGEGKPAKPCMANRCKYHVHNEEIPRCT